MKSFYKISLILLYLFISGKSLFAFTLSDSIVVAKDGSGNFTTVGAAFNSIPNNNTTWKTIYIKKGTYYEKDTLALTKNYVIIKGESRDSSIITYDDYSGKVIYTSPTDSIVLGTSNCQTLYVLASNVQFQNLTIQNTQKYYAIYYPTTTQAVALNVKGDKLQFVNCNIFGYQDTYYSYGSGRYYFRNCHIEGTTDFMFGKGITVFDSCDILIKKNSTYTAAATDTLYKFGYVYLKCTFRDSSCTSTIFGRPWHGNPRVVLIQCYESAAVAPVGWVAWNVPPMLYAEYNCSGPGYNPATRDTSLSRQLTSGEAATYTLQNIFSSASCNYAFGDWMPWYITSVTDKNVNEIPGSFSLNQNYPNPFNPSTAISYRLSAVSQTTLKVYDILGREVATLVNEVQQAGNYKINFNAGNLPSGVYFYKLQSGNFNETKKMLLIK